MSASSLFSGVGASDNLSSFYAMTSATTAGALTAAESGGSNGSAATSFSPGAKLFQKLDQLSQDDPDSFKAVTATIAAQLQAQAQQDDAQPGQALAALAHKFQQASQTGGLALTPAPRQIPAAPVTATTTAAAAAASAYRRSSGQDLGGQISAVISQALAQDTGHSAMSLAA